MSCFARVSYRAYFVLCRVCVCLRCCYVVIAKIRNQEQKAKRKNAFHTIKYCFVTMTRTKDNIYVDDTSIADKHSEIKRSNITNNSAYTQYRQKSRRFHFAHLSLVEWTPVLLVKPKQTVYFDSFEYLSTIHARERPLFSRRCNQPTGQLGKLGTTPVAQAPHHQSNISSAVTRLGS